LPELYSWIRTILLHEQWGSDPIVLASLVTLCGNVDRRCTLDSISLL
jgi:hypothetical protein